MFVILDSLSKVQCGPCVIFITYIDACSCYEQEIKVCQTSEFNGRVTEVLSIKYTKSSML